MVLYLKDESSVAVKWVEVLNSITDSNQKPNNSNNFANIDLEQQQHHHRSKSKHHQKKNKQKHFFDLILTREHCIVDRQVKLICRNKDIFLEGRSLKNILFITNDIKDGCLIHQNAIYVRPYHGNKYENTLAKLKVYLLKHILESTDVREIVKRDFLQLLKSQQS